MKKLRTISCIAAASLLLASTLPLTACAKSEKQFVLRVASWEEYIDLGGWEDDELIDIDNPYGENGVIGINSMVDDFTKWFNSEDFGFTVKVEYSTFGTNEDLYNRLNLGDKYDLVCPSDYMIMKLLADDRLEPFSESFSNAEIESNYYAGNVSPYIKGVFADNGWSNYAACYMWGTTGVIYNPDIVDAEDVSSWTILQNENYKRRVTIKDNVRDSYFPALGILNQEELLSDSVSPERRSELLNATDQETVDKAEQILKDIKENVYSFETDSGKADMITGKVAANYQWSGDGVFIMDEAESDTLNPTELWYSVPDECTNLWFDGWVMLKDGIENNEQKKIAAEAFINFLSRPDNAIRNMYYIGYTSSIAGDMMYDYLDYNYGAEFDAESEDYDKDLTEICEYDLSYFFVENEPTTNTERSYKLLIDASQLEIDKDNAYSSQIVKNGKEYTLYSNVTNISRGRQAFAQYPPQSVIERSVVMIDFGDRLYDINQMWINVRCLDLKDFNPAIVWTVVVLVVVIATAIVLYRFRYKLFYRERKNKD